MKRLISQWLYMSIIIGLTLILIFIGGTKHPVVAADTEGKRVKVVKRVLINEGDTLWEIASNYYSSEYKSIENYIDEIKRCNGIASDRIYKGQYIILPYYDAGGNRDFTP